MKINWKWIIVGYILVGLIFGYSSYIERASYAKFSLTDFLIGVIVWPLSILTRLGCHSGDITKILQGCTMLPPGMS